MRTSPLLLVLTIPPRIRHRVRTVLAWQIERSYPSPGRTGRPESIGVCTSTYLFRTLHADHFRTFYPPPPRVNARTHGQRNTPQAGGFCWFGCWCSFFSSAQRSSRLDTYSTFKKIEYWYNIFLARSVVGRGRVTARRQAGLLSLHCVQ
jgi:hypothetical protein